MKKILVIDDDPAVLEFLRAKLGSRHEVVCASSSEGILGLVRRERPDLIVCDVELPDMDGGDISAELFADDELRHIPLLFLTALIDADALRRQGGQLGGRPAVAKSEPPAAIVARIESLLGG